MPREAPVLKPLRCWLGKSSLVARLTARVSHLLAEGQPRFGHYRPGARKRCPHTPQKAQRVGVSPVLSKDRAIRLLTFSWRRPTLLRGARQQFSSRHGVAGDGINSRFQNQKMLVCFRLISYPLAAKSVSTLAVSVGCMGKGGQFPNCKPSAPSAVQGSIPQAEGSRLLTRPCCAFFAGSR